MRTATVVALSVAAVASAQTLSPSLQQFLSGRQVGAQQLLSGVTNFNIPAPAFGTQVLTVENLQCHYGANQGGSGLTA
jgi:hypothetical protein